VTGRSSWRRATEAVPATAAIAPVVRRSWFSRLLDSIARFFFPAGARSGGRARAAERRSCVAAQVPASDGRGRADRTLVNAMLGPALMPAAEDLANKIAAHLERT